MDLDGLNARLASRRTAVIEPALREVVQLGEGGERVILAAWTTASGFARLMMAEALGDRRQCGPADELLREGIRASGPGTQNLRCVSILSLAKRAHAAATADLVAAVVQRDGLVKQYALVALAGVGDERGWTEVLSWLAHYRPGRNTEPPSQPALSYLIRHLPAQSADRRAEFVRLIRRRWPVLLEDGIASLVLAAWPTVAPGGPAIPDEPATAHLGGVDWARHPLLASSTFHWQR